MPTSLQLPRPGTRIWALALALTTGVTLSSCGDGGSNCGGPFCIGPEPPQATTLKKGDGDGQQGAPGRELARPLEVIVTDDTGKPIQDVVVRFSVGSGGGSLSDAETRSDVQGRARVNWTLGSEVGAQSAQATGSKTSGSPLNGAPITFAAQAVRPPPAKLVIRQAPSVSARSGVPLEQQPVIDVLDASDQPVPDIQVSATIATGGGTLNGTASVVSDASGRATYTNLALTGPSGPRTLRFSIAEPALEVVSGSIVVGAGGPAQLAAVPPLAYEGVVTSPVSPAPSVVVKDASGNPVPGVAVSFTANRDASVSPEAPETVPTDEQGIARVTSWTLGSSITGQYILTASVEGSTLPAVRFTATTKPGAAGRLVIVTQPSSPAQNGTPFSQQPVIQVTDQDGNPAPQGNVLVTATVSSGPTGGVQNATATTDATGKASFSALTLTGTVGNYTISFSAEGLTGVNSNPITLTVGAPAQLALAAPPPATSRSRAALTPAPVIQVQDAGGNAVAQEGISITASVDPSATLGGPVTAATGADGRATFTGLVVSGSPGQKTLSFGSTSPALQGVSAQVTLPDVASVEVQTPGPASAQVNAVISGVPVWVLKDFAGQPVSDAPFTLAASANGSVVPVSGTSGDNGLAQVQSWTVGTTAGDQYVEIRVTGTALSSQVHVLATAADAANLLKISGDNQTVSPPDSVLANPLVVRVTDGYGNGVSGVTVQWRGCDGSGTYNPTTDVNGYSSASQKAPPSAGTYCAQASAFRSDGTTQLAGSPVKFSYTVRATSPSASEARIGTGRSPAVKAPPPGPPQSKPARPSSSR